VSRATVTEASDRLGGGLWHYFQGLTDQSAAKEEDSPTWYGEVAKLSKCKYMASTYTVLGWRGVLKKQDSLTLYIWDGFD
jgi:hypothetical protein